MLRKLLLIPILAIIAFSCQKIQDPTQTEAGSDDTEVKNAIEADDVIELGVTEIKFAETVTDCMRLIIEGCDLSLSERIYVELKLKKLEYEYAQEGYKKISISYPSVDAQGNETRLSGAIYMPRDPGTFDELLLYCHQTSTGNTDVPSSDGDLCLEPLVVSQCSTCVCFASDYIGFNSSESYNHPYMNNTLAARNEVDMMKAGLVYLKEHGYNVKTADDSLKTYVVGYSQGGGVALATHKALEQDADLCKEINFCGSLCGDGPYNLRTTFQKFINDSTMAMPFVLPYVLIGMYESYPETFEGIDIYDYLSTKCKETQAIEYLKSKPTLVEALVWFPQNVGSDIADILSTEAQNTDSEIMQTLFSALDKQNLLDGGWTPEKPVVIYHSEKDNVVSYDNAREALNLFPSTVCNRSSLDKGLYHIVEYVNFAANFISDGPSEMMKKVKSSGCTK